MADNPAFNHMNKSNIAIVLAVVAVAVSLAAGLWPATQPSVSTDPGFTAGGLERNIRENLRNGVNLNALGSFNGVLTVASGAYSYKAPEVCDYNVINHDGDGYASAQAQKWPSASSLIQNCLPNKGDYKSILFFNSSADENPHLAPTSGQGAGIDLHVASSSTGTQVEVPIQRAVVIRFWNLNGSSVSLDFQELK